MPIQNKIVGLSDICTITDYENLIFSKRNKKMEGLKRELKMLETLELQTQEPYTKSKVQDATRDKQTSRLLAGNARPLANIIN